MSKLNVVLTICVHKSSNAVYNTFSYKYYFLMSCEQTACNCYIFKLFKLSELAKPLSELKIHTPSCNYIKHTYETQLQSTIITLYGSSFCSRPTVFTKLTKITVSLTNINDYCSIAANMRYFNVR